MPRKKNTRAAQGTGSIRKKTVLREGREYSYWEARVTVGVDPGTGKQIPAVSQARRKKRFARKCRPLLSPSMTETISSRQK